MLAAAGRRRLSPMQHHGKALNHGEAARCSRWEADEGVGGGWAAASLTGKALNHGEAALF